MRCSSPGYVKGGDTQPSSSSGFRPGWTAPAPSQPFNPEMSYQRSSGTLCCNFRFRGLPITTHRATHISVPSLSAS